MNSGTLAIYGVVPRCFTMITGCLDRIFGAPNPALEVMPQLFLAGFGSRV